MAPKNYKSKLGEIIDYLNSDKNISVLGIHENSSLPYGYSERYYGSGYSYRKIAHSVAIYVAPNQDIFDRDGYKSLFKNITEKIKPEKNEGAKPAVGDFGIQYGNPIFHEDFADVKITPRDAGRMGMRVVDNVIVTGNRSILGKTSFKYGREIEILIFPSARLGWDTLQCNIENEDLPYKGVSPENIEKYCPGWKPPGDADPQEIEDRKRRRPFGGF